MGSVDIRSVNKAFGKVPVIHDVSLRIDDGEFLVLVGPSGCGKSTLLRMIAGLEDITSGEIAIGNRVVNDLAPKDRDIAMVFQSYALYPHMTVEQNMGYSLKMKHVAKAERHASIERVAAVLGLTPYLKRYPRQLSGGQRQRVAMGRAIVRDPAVFLFDEPLSNLDAKLRVAMRSEIKLNHQRLHTTTIYVTHDQIEAMTLADRIVVINNGRIEQVGTPLELYDRPVNLFVAGFIGSPAMNFLDGVLASGEVMLRGDTRLKIVGAPQTRAERAVKLGVRPQDFLLSQEGMKLEVITVEPTGAETLVTGRVADVDVTCALHERVEVRVGHTLSILPRPGLAHLFDTETGARIETAS